VTSKERIMCALNREKPDRLPVSVHQWQGYHLDTCLDGISDVEAFKRFGMDAQVQYFEDMGQFWLVDADYTKASTPEWRDQVEVISADPDNRINHHTITTPQGVLTYKTGGDRKTTWITEYLIKRDEDLELIRKYMPVPKLDLKPLEAFYANVGDAGIVRGFVWGDQAGCWQHAACLKDVTELIFKAMDDPAWVHELLQILLHKKLEFVESMRGAKFDLVETGGGSGSSTLISPDLHEEFCLPEGCTMPFTASVSRSPTTPAGEPSVLRNISRLTVVTPPKPWPPLRSGATRSHGSTKRRSATGSP
jgi:uroporphyrinogen decarboxylase